MFDTTVTIVGNALNTPEWRRLPTTKAVVAKFRVAATSRRYDKERGRWVDGASLRLRVNCWRRLAENVTASVLSGDPLIVTGRMYTRDWIGDDGQRRTSYEMDAMAVGHDLGRGQSRFTRNRHEGRTTVIEEEPAERAGDIRLSGGDDSGIDDFGDGFPRFRDPNGDEDGDAFRPKDGADVDAGSPSGVGDPVELDEPEEEELGHDFAIRSRDTAEHRDEISLPA